MEGRGGMALTGENRRTLKETYPNATLSISSPTRTDRGAIPCFRGEKPATELLNHGTVQLYT
jgi:hypothetical protein